MLRCVSVRLGRSLNHSMKFPAVISYNTLPWEIINHETPALHMHLAPQYEQILTLASTTNVPHLIRKSHPTVEVERQLRTLPGVLYVMSGNATPVGFTPYIVTDHVALQYYGRLNHNLARVKQVQILTSEDLRLLCLCVTFDALKVNVAPYSALFTLTSKPQKQNNKNLNSNENNEEVASSRELLQEEWEEEEEEQREEQYVETHSEQSKSEHNVVFSLYHYFRPNRPVSELTRPLEKFYVHRPNLLMLNGFAAAKNVNSSDNSNVMLQKSNTIWEPRLNVPNRAKNAKVTPLPAYRPPKSYLMGLAERLAIVPGSCFGKRYLMWGYWF